MNDLAVNQVLAQIRAMGAQAGARPQATSAGPAPVNGGFQSFLKSSLDNVSAAQAKTADLQQKFQMGDRNTDLSSVMLASARSGLAFKATVEVRNRLVSAYQDIMNMPV